jgi:hypothetical protein
LYLLRVGLNFLIQTIINQVIMAAKTAKTSAKSAAPKAPAKSKSKASPADLIEKASAQALATLQSLGIEPQLQQDLEWCLGSYRYDKNPSGLYEMAKRTIAVLQEAKARKAKGVTAKVIGDLEKAVTA